MSEPHEVGLIVVVRRESSDIFESINGTKNLAQSGPRLRLLGPDEIQRLLGKRHLEPFLYSVKKNSRLSPSILPGKNRGKFPGFTAKDFSRF